MLSSYIIETLFPRHGFLLWLVVKGRLKTKSLLVSRGMNVDLTCVLCGFAVESCSHLFFECSYVKRVWRTVLLELHRNHIPLQWREEWAWLRKASRGGSVRNQKLRSAFSAMIYWLGVLIRLLSC